MFLMTMLNFSKETRKKKHGDSSDKLSVIIFHLQLINESPFHFGLYLLPLSQVGVRLLYCSLPPEGIKENLPFLFMGLKKDCDYYW